jgi:hypothetical protein
MRWCWCYEGQRTESWGCQGPSHTGLIIIQLLLYIGSTEEVVSLFEIEFQKPRNLSESESEECGSGEGVCVFASLMKSDTVQSYGRVKADTRPVGVELRKKPKDLSASEREERGHGKGVGCMLLFFFCQFSPFFFFVSTLAPRWWGAYVFRESCGDWEGPHRFREGPHRVQHSAGWPSLCAKMLCGRSFLFFTPANHVKSDC